MKLVVVASCLLALLALAEAQVYDDWIKAVDAPEGESIMFNCTEVNYEDPVDSGHPREDPDGTRPWNNTAIRYWLAYLTRINPGECINGNNTCVSSNGSVLTIDNVTPDDFGVYHCVMQNIYNDEYYLVRWGLNMRGPYFEDLWDKYQMNVIIGISAMAGFLVLAAFVLGVWHFRWIDPEKEALKKEAALASYDLPSYSDNGYANGKAEIIGAYDSPVVEASDESNVAHDYLELTPSEPKGIENPSFTAADEVPTTSTAEVHNAEPTPTYTTTFQRPAAAAREEPEVTTF